MRHRIAISALIVVLGDSAAPAQTAISGKQLVEDFLRIADQRSMFATGERWERIKTWARVASGPTTDNLSAYPIISAAVKALGDEHGGINPSKANSAAYQKRYGRLWTKNTSRQPTSNFVARTKIEAADLRLPGPGRARLIVIPRIFQNDDEQAYASKLFETIAAAPRGTCGYVLDLRGNIGGDMWPMLAGLSPLLGSENVGAFTNKEALSSKWHVALGRSGELGRDGAYQEEFAMKSVGRVSPALSKAPVALLIDDGVLSSGEVVTIAFHGRPHTRSFGAHTYGLSTVNTPFELADGTQLYLSTGVYVDRRGRRYPSGIAPDVAADPSDGAIAGSAPALKAAKVWLARQPGCR